VKIDVPLLHLVPLYFSGKPAQQDGVCVVGQVQSSVLLEGPVGSRGPQPNPRVLPALWNHSYPCLNGKCNNIAMLHLLSEKYFVRLLNNYVKGLCYCDWLFCFPVRVVLR
jgi:hypothetical protein